ncbi:MAG: hypothetical protein ABIQ18_40200 [Umezawaea sp.]
MKVLVTAEQHHIGHGAVLRQRDHVTVDEGIDALLLVLAVEPPQAELHVVEPGNGSLLGRADAIASRVVPVGAQHRRSQTHADVEPDPVEHGLRIQDDLGSRAGATAQLTARRLQIASVNHDHTAGHTSPRYAKRATRKGWPLGHSTE